MKKILLTLLLSINFILISYAQVQNYFEQYRLLRSQGTMPAEYSKILKENPFNKKQNSSSKKTKTKIRKKFSQEISFTANGLLQTGDVLYNDDISVYLNKILDELLINDKALRTKVQAYVVKSNAVNSFVTSNGMICLTIGMITSVKNEAELAFIMSREIVHFQKEHMIASQNYQDEVVANSAGIFNKLSKEQAFLLTDLYSIDNQTDADTASWKIFSKSKYASPSLEHYFKMYQVPTAFENQSEIDYTEFENAGLKVSTLVKNFVPTKNNFSINSIQKSKPELYQRYVLLDSIIKSDIGSDKKEFILPVKDFDFIQRVANYEYSYNALIHGDAISAYHNTYLRLEKDTGILFLIENKCKALYMLSLTKQYGNNIVYNNYLGQTQKLAYFLNTESQMPEKYDAFLLRYILKYRLQYKNNPDINNIFRELVKKHVVEYDVSIDSIKSAYKFFQETKNDSFSWASILYPIIENDVINAEWKKYEEDKEDIRNYRREYPNFFVKTCDDKLYGRAVGVRNVIVANPSYTKIQTNDSKTKVNIKKTKKGELKYYTALQQMSKLLGLKISILKPSKFKVEDADKLAHISILNQWLIERLSYLNIQDPKTSAMQKVSTVPEYELDRLVNAYQTEHVMWQVLTHNQDLRMLPANIASSFLLFTLPNTIPAILKNGNSMFLYTMVFNINSGELEFFNATFIDDKMYKYMLEGKIYNDLHQIYEIPKGGEAKLDMISDRAEKTKKKTVSKKKKSSKKKSVKKKRRR